MQRRRPCPPLKEPNGSQVGKFLTFMFSSVLQTALCPIFLKGHSNQAITQSTAAGGDSEQPLAFPLHKFRKIAGFLSYKSYDYSCNLTDPLHFRFSVPGPPTLIGYLGIQLLFTGFFRFLKALLVSPCHAKQ